MKLEFLFMRRLLVFLLFLGLISSVLGVAYVSDCRGLNVSGETYVVMSNIVNYDALVC